VLGTVAADGTGAWQFATAGLADGPHSFTATASNLGGTASPASDALVVTIDTAAPAAPVITGFSDDSAAAGDGITNDNTTTLTGTAEAGATVEIFDGATSLGTVTATGAGVWSFTSAALTDGAHSFTATATDAAGNVSVASAALALSIDTAAPAAPVISSFSDDTGTANDGITSDSTLTLTGTAEANATVEIFDGASSLGTVTATAGGTWSFTTAGLGDGAHSFTARAADMAGNEGARSTALNVTVDTSAPAIAITTPISGDDLVNAAEDNALFVSGTAAGAQTVNVTFRDGAGATVTGTAAVSGAGAWTLPVADISALQNGTITVEAYATDAAGNQSGTVSRTITLDNAAPAAPVITGFTENSGNGADDTTNDNTPTLTGTADAGATIEIFESGASLGTTTADGSGAWSFTTAVLTDGVHYLAAQASDAAGNRSAQSAIQNVLVDTVAPVLTITTPISGDGLVNAIEDGLLSVSGTAPGAQTISVTFRDAGGATVTGTAIANGVGAWTLPGADISALQNGTITIEAYATDQAGNQSTTVSQTVTLDNVAPATPVISGISEDTGVPGDQMTSDETVTLTGSAEAGATVEVFDNGVSLGTATASGAGVWTFTTEVLTEATHTITVQSTDAAGNKSPISSSFGLTIDTTAPTVAITSPIQTDNVVNAAEDGSVTVSGTSTGGQRVYVTFRDGAGATVTEQAFVGGTSWTLTSSDISGLQNGPITVEAYAVDQAGNQSGTATQTITLDNIAPAAPVITTTPAGQTADNTPTFSGTAEAGTTVNIYAGGLIVATGTADGSGNWTATTGVLSDGYTSFTARATDSAGNQGPASGSVVLIIDTTPPGVPAITGYTSDTGISGDDITNDATLTLSGTAQAGSSRVVIYDNGVELGTAVVSGGTWTYTTAALDDGAHSLTVAARDYVGNESGPTAGLAVTIDTTAPGAPSITGFSDDTGVSGDGITSDTTLTLTGTAEAGGTVEIFRAGVSIGTASVDGAGDWSFTTGVLTSGAQSFTARETDAQGNTGALSGTFAVTIDTIAPPAPVIIGFSDDTGIQGDRITSDTTLTLTGTALANSTIEIFDGAVSLGTVTANGAGAWSFATATLTTGSHDFTATASDAAGNTGSASAVLAITVDTVAPAAPVLTGISSDTGASATDEITSDTTLTISGTAVAFATIEVFDGATSLGTVQAASNGAWNFATGTLTEGPHSFTATATGAAGLTSAASAALPVTIDTTAPSTPVITGFSDDTGNPDGQTSDNTLTFTGTADAGVTVSIFVGAQVVATGVADGSGNWTATTGELTDGYRNFNARAEDAAGNLSPMSAPTIVIIDTTPPGIPAITGYSTDSGVPGDDLTNDTTLTITGTAQAGSSRVVIYDGGIELGTAVVSGGTWSFTAAALADGPHDFTAAALDYVGNESAQTGALTVTIDATAPGAPAITGFSDDTGTPGDGFTSDTTLTLTGTAAAAATVTIYDGATLLGTATANGGGNWTFNTAELSEGAHSFTATATDAAGNASAASPSLGVTVQLTVTTTPVITGFSDDTGNTGDNLTSDTSLILTGTAEAGASVEVFRSAVSLGTTTADGSGNWSFATATLSEGSHAFTARATAPGGSASGHSTQVTIAIDTTAPGITLSSPVSGDGVINASEQTNVSLSGTAPGGQQVEITFRDSGGATVTAVATTNGVGAWTLGSTDISSLQDGTITIEAIGVDAAGNRSTMATQSITLDTVRPDTPVITGMSDDTGYSATDHQTSDQTLTFTGTAGAGETVNIYLAGSIVATGIADGTGAWTATTGTIAEGYQTFSARAVDAAGNQSLASSGFVAIIDTTTPDTPVITGYSNDSGTPGDGLTNDTTLAISGTGVSGTTAVVYDNGVEIGTVQINGGTWTFNSPTLAEGDHSFTVTARDTAGNESAATPALDVTIDVTAPAAPAIATVSDDNGPVSTYATSDTVVVAGTAEAGATVNVYVAGNIVATGIADGSGNWSATTSSLPDAYTSITARAVDAAGNNSPVSGAKIIFIDTLPPGIPEITGFTNDTGVPGDGISSYSWTQLSGTAAAGTSRVVIYDNGVALGTAQVSGGTWTFTASPLSEGVHSLTAAGQDYPGNESAQSAATVFTVDLTIPDAPVITGYSDDTGTPDDGRTGDNTLAVSGTAEAGASIEVFDLGVSIGTTTADAGGNWTYSTAALGEGVHRFTAQATDASGRTGSTSNAVLIAVDLTAPDAPVITGYSDDTGPTGDGITGDTTLTLTGTAEGNSVVEIFDGATSLGTTTAAGNGAWTFTTSELAEAAHSFTARAIDVVGNESAASAALDVTVDTTPAAATATPVITSITDDTGTPGDGVTLDTTLTIIGTTVAGAIVEVFDGATSLGTVIATGTGTWFFSTAVLGEGVHSFTATATASGLSTSTASAAFDVTIDTTGPAAPVISGIADDGGSVSSQTSDNTLTFTGTAEAGSTVYVYGAGAAVVATAITDGSGDWTATSGALAEGYTSFYAQAVDIAGNYGPTSTSTVVIIDTTAPDAPVITGFSDDTGTSGDGETTDTTLVISGTAATGTSTVVIYDNGLEIGTAAVSGGNWAFNTATLATGNHSFTAAGRDYVGNTSTASAAVDVSIVEAVIPAVPVITSISEDTGYSTGDKQTNDTTPTIFGTADAGVIVRIYIGGASVGTTTADGSGDWSFTTAELSDAYHYVTARAEDGAGNNSARTGTTYVLIDSSAPGAPVITTPVAGDGIVNASEDGYFNVSGTAVGLTYRVHVTFTDGAGAKVTGIAQASGTSWTLSGANISGLQNGTITVDAVSEDRAGNLSVTATETITLDNVAPAVPVISGFTDDTGIPNGQTSDTTPTFTGTAEAGMTVNLYLASAIIATTTADGSGNWTATSSVLAEGYHYITAKAVDAAGNLSAPTGITIVWVDTTAPAAPTLTGFSTDTDVIGDGITSDNTITLTGTRPGGTLVAIFDNGVEIGEVPMTGSSWSFTTGILADGEHSFTVAARDGAGNDSVPTAALPITISSASLPAASTLMFTATEDTSGSDTYTIDDPLITSLSGGGGTDTLAFTATGAPTPVLDFTLIDNGAVSGIEQISMADGNAQALNLTAADILAMSDNVVNIGGTDVTRLTVFGDANDSVSTGDTGWSADGTDTVDGATFDVFNNGTAQLYVEADVAATVAAGAVA